MNQIGPDMTTYQIQSCSSGCKGDWQLVYMRNKGGISTDYALEHLQVAVADIAPVLLLLAEKPFVTVSDMCQNTYDWQDQLTRLYVASLGSGQFHELSG